MGLMLVVAGTPITNKEAMNLIIAAKRGEIELWHRKELLVSQSEAKRRPNMKRWRFCNKNVHMFPVRYTYHWLPSGQRLKINNHLEDDAPCVVIPMKNPRIL